MPIKRIAVTEIVELERVGWIGQPTHSGRLTCPQVADHARRIQEADLDRPLFFSADGHLLDGFDRVCKAHLTGVTMLPAVQIEQDPPPNRIRPLPEWFARTL